MNIKGTAFITAKVGMTAAFGEERWNAFLNKISAKDPFFKNLIMSITPIPVEKHLFFLDEMLKEFFGGDVNQYQLFGRVTAFSLSPGGAYNSYLMTKDLGKFVSDVAPRLWATYFDGGKFTGELKGNVAYLQRPDIPIKHIYFEYLVIGFSSGRSSAGTPLGAPSASVPAGRAGVIQSPPMITAWAPERLARSA